MAYISPKFEHAIERPNAIALAMQEVQWTRLTEVANNLSASHVPGFKATCLKTEEHSQKRPHLSTRSVSYTKPGDQIRLMRDGTFRQTDHPFDVALSGPGFLAVQTPNGIRYTRCGQLTLNEAQEIVTAVGGYPVLSQDQGKMTCSSHPKNVLITRDGYVIVPAEENKGGGNQSETVGRIGTFEFKSPNHLKNEGHCLLSSKEEAIPSLNTVITQHGLEDSNVSPMEESIRMIEILRLFENAQKVIDEYDQIRKKTINASSRNAI